MLLLRLNVPTPSLTTYEIFVFFCFWKVFVPKPNEHLYFPLFFPWFWYLQYIKAMQHWFFVDLGPGSYFQCFLYWNVPSLGGAFKCFKWAPFGYFSRWFSEPPKIDFGELGPKGSKGHVFFWFWKVVVFKASETFVFEFWLVWVIRTYQAFAWVSSFCC